MHQVMSGRKAKGYGILNPSSEQTVITADMNATYVSQSTYCVLVRSRGIQYLDQSVNPSNRS